jgi:glycosyltransferase involved in cell wall biosynthesis
VSDTPSSSGIETFFDIAARCPGHRFVMAIDAGLDAEAARLVEKTHSQSVGGEFLVNAPPDELRSLQARAGLYLHTVFPGGADEGLSIGESTAIAEAMATGAYIVVPKGNPLAADMAKAGRQYRTPESAAALINESAGWSDAEWHQAWLRSINRSFKIFADELVFRPLFDDWCGVLECAQ